MAPAPRSARESCEADTGIAFLHNTAVDKRAPAPATLGVVAISAPDGISDHDLCYSRRSLLQTAGITGLDLASLRNGTTGSSR